MIKCIFLLLVIATVVAVWAINWHRMKTALRMRDAKIPVCRDDCFHDYEEVIKVVMKRLSAVQGVKSQTELLNELGFKGSEDMRAFYPAIAMIRLCHLTGYEIEFRNMRTEHSPIGADEIVSRMRSDEVKQAI